MALGVFLTFSSSAQTTLFTFGSTWRYLDNGSNQGTAWRGHPFDDSGWKSGPGKFGFGIDDASTVIQSNAPSSLDKYVTTYFRKTISLSNAAALGTITANVKYDDGLVMYVNGTEVLRNNMPEGPIDYNTLASVTALKNGYGVETFTFSGSAFVEGDNLIAVEVHQKHLRTSDMAFDLEFLTTGETLQEDITAPVVSNITRQNPVTDSTSASSLTFRVIFSEEVTGVSTPNFLLTTSGTATGSIGKVTTVNSATYDVTITNAAGEGTIQLTLLAAGANIQDLASNLLTLDYSLGQSYTHVLAPVETTPLLPITFKSAWKYLDNGSDQGIAWRDLSYDDTNWQIGNGELGYGDGDEATVVSYGSSSSNKHITTYFRKSIFIPDASLITSISGNLKRDDGAIIYVNGVEVFRSKMPSGPISYNTLAAESGNSAVPFKINASAFTTGINIIAVEVHQLGASNSDLSFDLELKADIDTLNYEIQSKDLIRGAYLQVGSQTAVTVRWRTNTASDSKVEVGTVLGTYPLSFTNDTLTQEHEVRITGLSPNTNYVYRIGSSTEVLQSGSGNFFKTAPPENSTEKVRVAVFGDCGKDKYGNRTGSLNSYLNYTGSKPAELMLLLGDNAYDDGSDADYQREFFTPYGSTVLKNHILFPAPGNHEYHLIPLTARNKGGYYTSFSLPTAGESGGVPSGSKAFYSYDWGNIHFVSLDSYGVEADDNTMLTDTLGVQVQWLKRDLEANSKKWTIVYFHHPPFTMGSHNADTNGELKRIRQNFIRILERYGVDLVLSGHSHTYERSYLLNNFYGTEASFELATHTKSSSSAKYDESPNSCPYMTVSGTKNHGTVYVVAGSAGTTGNVQEEYPHDALPFAVNDGGMLYLEIEDNRLDAKMLRKDGTVFDNFTIMQDVNKTATPIVSPGGAVQLTASWVGNYQWSTGDTTRSITVNPEIPTSYEVMDNKSCLRDVFTVNVAMAADSSLQMKSPDPQLLAYPSPIQRGTPLTVTTSLPEGIAIQVTDLTGRTLFQTRVSGTTSINTTDLPSGLYIIRSVGAKANKQVKFVITD